MVNVTICARLGAARLKSPYSLTPLVVVITRSGTSLAFRRRNCFAVERDRRRVLSGSLSPTHSNLVEREAAINSEAPGVRRYFRLDLQRAAHFINGAVCLVYNLFRRPRFARASPRLAVGSAVT